MPSRQTTSTVIAAVVALMLGLAACTSARGGQVVAKGVAPMIDGTVAGVGQLPGPMSSIEVGAPLESIVAVPSATLAAADDEPAPVVTLGADLEGNRVLMIGDSIFASLAARYSGAACKELVPRGWQVELDAETGRFIEFGRQVLRQRVDADWDVIVVLLGNNYSADPEYFRGELVELIELAEPTPVALLTTMVFRDVQEEVNEAIRDTAETHANVTVVEWADFTDPDLTGDDGLHLTDAGHEELAGLIGEVLGDAPLDEDGKCLSTSYTDDSAGSPEGPDGNQSGTTKSTTKSTTKTTTKPSTSTTAKPSSSTTVKPTTVTTRPATTTPQATTPQATNPQQTSPPQTTSEPDPQPTDPPQTETTG